MDCVCNRTDENLRAPNLSYRFLLCGCRRAGPPVVHQGVPLLGGDAFPQHSDDKGSDFGHFGHQGHTRRVLHRECDTGASIGKSKFHDGLHRMVL